VRRKHGPLELRQIYRLSGWIANRRRVAVMAWIAAGIWLLVWGLQSGVRMVRHPN